MFFTNNLQSDGTMGMFTPGDLPATAPSPTSINWNEVIKQSFGLASHAFSAFGGANSGQQIGYDPSRGAVFAIQPLPASFDDKVPAAKTLTGQEPRGPGSTLGSGVDGIFNWLMANPLITFGGVAGLYLLFREPPRRR